MAETKAKEKKPAAKKAAPKATPKPKEKSVDKDSFAVIATGGKQYVVRPGMKVRVEKMKGDYKEGDKITFDQVLLSVGGDAVKVGSPLVSGATAVGTITKIGRAKKITVIKYKQKSRYFKKRGHRQPFFEVEITSI